MKKSKPKPFNAKSTEIAAWKAGVPVSVWNGERWVTEVIAFQRVTDEERHLARSFVTIDKLHAIDFEAYHSRVGLFGVSVTTRSHEGVHLAGLADNRLLRHEWMRFGHRFMFVLYPDKPERDEGNVVPDRIEITRKFLGMGQYELELPTHIALPWEGVCPTL